MAAPMRGRYAQEMNRKAKALIFNILAGFRRWFGYRAWMVLSACLLLAGGSMAAPASERYWEDQSAVMFQRLGRERGLPGDIVTAIAQDGAGFIWVGTPVGLARYDGYRFTLFQPDPRDPASLPDGYVNALHVDRAGRLWVATNTGGLVRYVPDTGGFARYAVHAGGRGEVPVERIAEDLKGDLWLATRAGLVRMNPDSGVLQTVPLEGPAPVTAGMGSDVTALQVDHDGVLWIGTSRGLRRKTPADPAFQDAGALLRQAGLPDDAAISALFSDDQGRLWVATRSGSVLCHDPARQTVRLYDVRLATDQMTDHHVIQAFQDLPTVVGGDARRRIWLATSPGGLLELEEATGTVRPIRHDPALGTSLSGDVVHMMLRDRAGLIWVATWGSGLNVHNPANTGILSVFYLPGPAAAPRQALVRSALTTREGEIWLGLEGQGIERLDPASGRHSWLLPGTGDGAALPRATVLSLAQDAAGDVWIGTLLGLVRYNRQTGRVERVPLPAGLDLLPVYAILPVEGALWLASDGLIRYEPASGAVTRYRHDPDDEGSLSDDRVRVLAEAPGGAIWVGTHNGLHLLDTSQGRLRRVQNRSWDLRSLAHNFITALLHDRNGQLWVGTLGGGISVQDKNAGEGHFRFHQVNSRSGLPGDSVHALVQDADGRVWANTEGGLARIDPETLSVRAFDLDDGVGVHGASMAVGAALPDGALLFGGREGLSIARPAWLRDWTYQPPLVVTDMRIDNRPVPSAGLNNAVSAVAGRPPSSPAQIILPPHSRTLALSFAALDFAGPDSVRYAYHLSGFDEGWVQADALSRTATYTNLPPGDYVLRLRATNKDGQWGASIRSLAVKVLPAWYQTLWAKAAALLLGLGLVALLVQARTAALRHQRRRLESVVADRTRDLMDANAELQRLASTDPLTGLLNRRRFDELAQAEIERASRYARPLSLLLIDLDHFKRINDTHGHAMGDVALQEAARRLLAAVRSTDRVARYGGEEMAVLLPETPLAEAQELAERLRRVISDLPISHEGLAVRVTASLGVASFQAADGDIAHLLGRADAALYVAKQQGRDRVVVADDASNAAAAASA